MIPAKRLAAVVVTRNRCEKLIKAIDALRSQTRRPDRIYVVDNASTDATTARLETRRGDDLVHLRLPHNIGGAGGFNEGIKAAYSDGFDLIWTSDDDAYPNEDAIEKLIDGLIGFAARTGRRPSFACSAVRWTDGSWCEMNTPDTVWDWPRFYARDMPWFLVRSCSFVSILIPRWAVREHGLPIKDYFIWFDDTEYTRRLARSYPGIFVPDSLVIHDVEINQGVNFGMIEDETLWKFEYGARNEASFELREHGLAGFLSFLYRVRRQMTLARLPLRLRLPVYGAILRGLWFRPEIEFPERPKNRN